MNTIDETRKEIQRLNAIINSIADGNPNFWNDPEYKLTRRELSMQENELRYLELREVGKYCNLFMYTDVEPFEVVRKISDKTVEIRKMKSTQTVFPKDFRPGGFVGHYVDNRNQEYTFESDPDATVIRCRWSGAKNQWQSAYGRHIMSDRPEKFYDYNF